MSSPEIELKDSDFSVTRSRLARFNHKMVELPSRSACCTRCLARKGKRFGCNYWVFLSSLVITTVLAYGVGLSQLFFEESLKSEPFDAKIEYGRTPVETHRVGQTIPQ